MAKILLLFYPKRLLITQYQKQFVVYPVPWQGSPVPPGLGALTIHRGPTLYIVLVS